LSTPSIKLSANVNKVATLRNSRGGREPDVLEAVAVCVAAGVPGITVHPRADERHIRRSDVHDIAELLKRSPEVEYNIEGDPRPDFLELVLKVRPTQCTLVPVMPGEVTSQAGWPADTEPTHLRGVIVTLGAQGCDLWQQGQRTHVPGVAASEIIDPTGCGDAFRAALLYGIERDWPLLRCIELGNRVGAIKIACRGGQNHALPLGGEARS